MRIGLTMHGSSIKNRHFVRSDTLTTRVNKLLKLNNTINISTEKSYAFPFKDTSLDTVLLNPLEILPRQD